MALSDSSFSVDEVVMLFRLDLDLVALARFFLGSALDFALPLFVVLPDLVDNGISFICLFIYILFFYFACFYLNLENC